MLFKCVIVREDFPPPPPLPAPPPFQHYYEKGVCINFFGRGTFMGNGWSVIGERSGFLDIGIIHFTSRLLCDLLLKMH